MPRPAASFADFTLKPSKVQGGAGSTAAITLVSPAGPGGVDIRLDDGGSAVTDLPLGTTIHIAEGTAAGSLPITTTTVGGKLLVTISATRIVPASVTGSAKSRTLTVLN